MGESQEIEFLIYRSEAIHPQDHLSNLDILRTAEARNRRLGLTGFLSRDYRHFVQYLEGPRDALRDVLAKIERDPRHHSMVMLAQGTRTDRKFPDWDMGFAPVLGESEAPLGGRSVEDIQTRLAAVACGRP